jgi:hypothetical protein
MTRKTRSLIVEQLRDLAEAFRKNDPKTAKVLRLIAAHADAEDLANSQKVWKQQPVHVRAAVLDLCPVAYDWIRFGTAWPDSAPTFQPKEVAFAKKFLKKHRGDRHIAYNAALQRLIRTQKEEYATIAAWCRPRST